MLPQEITAYFDGLLARLPQALRPSFLNVPESLPHQCHKNADAYAARHLGHQAVRGWLVTPDAGIHMFHAHSVVRQPGGPLIDVTPGNEHRGGMLFLEHVGSPAQYEVLMVSCAQWFHPVAPGLSFEAAESYQLPGFHS